MQWRLFSQWDPIKFRWIISCSAPPLWTGIFILRKVWLGKLCWDAQGGSELGNQSEAKLDRPSDQWTVQGRIRVRAWKEAVCLLPSDNILNLISSPWFWLQPFYQQSQLRLAPLRNVTGPSLNESHSVVSDSLRPHGLFSPWNSPGQSTGVGSCPLLQEIFTIQGSNPGLPHCRQILYQLSHQGSPFLEMSWQQWGQATTLPTHQLQCFEFWPLLTSSHLTPCVFSPSLSIATAPRFIQSLGSDTWAPGTVLPALRLLLSLLMGLETAGSISFRNPQSEASTGTFWRLSD